MQEAWPWQSLEPGAAKLSGIKAIFLFHVHTPFGLGRAFKRTFPAPKQKVGLDGVFPSYASCRILDSINWVSKLYSFTIHGGEDPQNSTEESQAAAPPLSTLMTAVRVAVHRGVTWSCPPHLLITNSAPPRLYLLFWQYLETRGRRQEKERKSCQRLSCDSLLIKFIRLTSLSIF